MKETDITVTAVAVFMSVVAVLTGLSGRLEAADGIARSSARKVTIAWF